MMHNIIFVVNLHLRGLKGLLLMNDRSQTADEHSNAQSPVYIWKTGLALF